MLFISSFGLIFYILQAINCENLEQIESTLERPWTKDDDNFDFDFDFDFDFNDNFDESEIQIDNETIIMSDDPYHEATFHLFTRKNPKESQDLLIDDIDYLNYSNFNESWPTRILIHGWRDHKESRMNTLITEAYLKKGNFNVIVVNWGTITQNLNYLLVTRTVPEIGRAVAEFTQFLNRERNVQFNDIYLIGHSLGAHVAGFAGKFISPNRYNTIFALDTARPLFENRNETYRLNSNDAIYVESIHTSIIDVGYRTPLGQASFYPNYSRIQNGCFTVFCNHVRSIEFFAESINTKIGFYGRQCESFTDIIYRNCTSDNLRNQDDLWQKMGGEPSTRKYGVFYLPTASSSPFALGIF